MKLAFNWDVKPVYDVIATMRGAEEPDLWVLRGNHHDAWVNGADDPVSGQVVLLEEARALGELAKQGWKPKRTIIYASWDGEEPMLLGSTEWVEEHADELRQHAAVYINSDANDRGYLDVEGSHSLQSFMNGVAKDVEDPEAKVSVFKRRQAYLLLHGTPAQRTEARAGGNLSIGALGSGSDFSAFIDHVGVATINLGFREKIRRATITRSMTTFIGIPISPTTISCMAVRLRRPRAWQSYAWLTPKSCPMNLRASRKRSRSTSAKRKRYSRAVAKRPKRSGKI